MAGRPDLRSGKSASKDSNEVPKKKSAPVASYINTIFSNLPSAPSTAEERLILASAFTTTKFGEMVGKINQLSDDVLADGDTDQKLDAIKAMKDVLTSETAINSSHSGRLCVDNINKRLHMVISGQLTNIVNNDPAVASSATTYKMTFKPINLSANRPILDPLEELYDASKELEIQIIDSQSTPSGQVVYIQNQVMFEAAKAAINQHVVKSTKKPISDYFNITHQIISAYSVKTHTFNKSVLVKNNLIDATGTPVLKTEEVKTFLHKYNRGWFSSTVDIENVECFGLQKAGDDPLITLKIHVSHSTFKRFICAPVTNIMLRAEKIRIYEEVPVVQCLRCTSFGHIWRICTAEIGKCRFCGVGDNVNQNGHLSANCPNRERPTCWKCIEAGTTGDKVKHAATSFACPFLKKEAERLRREAKQKAMAAYCYN